MYHRILDKTGDQITQLAVQHCIDGKMVKSRLFSPIARLQYIKKIEYTIKVFQSRFIKDVCTK